MSDDAFDEDIVEPCPEGRGVTIDDFVAYSPTTVYIFTPCRETWTKTGVNSRLPRVPVLTKAGKPQRDKDGKPFTILATTWLDRNRAVEQMTWCPGYPMLKSGDASKAGPSPSSTFRNSIPRRQIGRAHV